MVGPVCRSPSTYVWTILADGFQVSPESYCTWLVRSSPNSTAAVIWIDFPISMLRDSRTKESANLGQSATHLYPEHNSEWCLEYKPFLISRGSDLIVICQTGSLQPYLHCP